MNFSGRLVAVFTAVDGIRVASLTGEIDYDTGETFRQAVHIADQPHPRLVVDLQQVTFMDSTGVNILIAAHRAHTHAGGWLRLAAPTESVLRTLQIVGVDEVIDCRRTLRQAIGI